MLDVLIVDDESLARQRLRNLLLTVEVDCNIREASNGLIALKLIAEKSPDILFLDIQMPELSGFDVLNHLEEPTFPVVFQTAFDEFAIKAFEVSACDYLLKPFTAKRLSVALGKAKSQIDINVQLKSLEQFRQEQKSFLNAVVLRSSREDRIKKVCDVEAFVSKDHCTVVVDEGKELVCDLSLDKLEIQLDNLIFFRCHRHAILNLKKVKSIVKSDSGLVEMKSGDCIEVSRRKMPALKQLLGF